MIGSIRSILVVDDEDRDLQVISDLLHEAGYNVCKATSYSDAVQCMANLTYVPDLLVTDIALPQVNGVELYRRISVMCGVYLNVLFISAYSGAEILKRYGIPLSDIHFLAKPFSAEALLSRVQSLLETPVPLRLAS